MPCPAWSAPIPGPAPPVGRDHAWEPASGCRAKSDDRDGKRAVSEQALVVDALALQAEEGRGALRKAPGSGRARSDPEIPEWGNPSAVMGGHTQLNL